MSRHRDVRNMDFTEDYDGYDDVYGHSMDDDYYISPSNRQFLFNRENSRDQPKIGEFICTEQDIQEEDESEFPADLPDLEKAKLESCIEQIKTTLGPLSISRNELVNIIISHNFDVEKATNSVLNDFKNTQVEKKEKDVTNSSKFFIPKLNGLKNLNVNSENLPVKRFNIPSFNSIVSGEKTNLKTLTIPKLTKFSQPNNESSLNTKPFNDLSELVSTYLSKSIQNKLSLDNNNQVNKVTTSIENMKIRESKDLHQTSSDFKIDLSVALKASPSTQSISSKSKTSFKEDSFEIPFYDCDADVDSITVLKCSFDIKDILKIHLQNVKAVSNFGKVLCRKYRKRLIKFKRSNAIRKVEIFDFLTPSPDDSISKHLRI